MGAIEKRMGQLSCKLGLIRMQPHEGGECCRGTATPVKNAGAVCAGGEGPPCTHPAGSYRVVGPRGPRD